MSETVLRAELSFQHVLLRARRRLFGERPLKDVADRCWTISPAETRRINPAVALADQFRKAFGIDKNTDWAREKLRAFGGEVRYPPVAAYKFTNAALFQGAVLCKQRGRRIVPFSMSPAPSSEFRAVSIDDGVLAGSYLGLAYFGHWVRDDATLSLMGENLGTPVSPAPPDWPHLSGYRKRMLLDWRVEENVRFKNLIVFDDEELTPHKASRLKTLRKRIEKFAPPGTGKRRIFIMRSLKDKGVRCLQNEAEIAEALVKDGFSIVDPGKMSVDEIAEAMHGADIVAGLEGSHLSHAVFFLRRGGKLLAITPPGRFCTSHKRWTDLLGMEYGYVVGDPAEEGFTASINDIRRTIDLFAN